MARRCWPIISVDRRDRAASLEELQQVREIGPVLAASVRSWFDEPANRELIDGFRSAGVKLTGERKAAPAGPQPLTGKTYVITGDADSACRARTRRRDRAARRQGDRLGQQENQLLIVGAIRASKLEKARATWHPDAR